MTQIKIIIKIIIGATKNINNQWWKKKLQYHVILSN